MKAKGSKSCLLVVTDESFIVANCIKPDEIFMILLCELPCPFNDQCDKFLSAKKRVGCNAMYIDSRISIACLPNFLITKRSCPHARNHPIYDQFPLVIFFDLGFHKASFKFGPHDYFFLLPL